MLITRDTLVSWLQGSGEIAYSEGDGAAMRADVHDSAMPLDFLWGRLNRPTVELYSAMSGPIDTSKLEATAQRVLEINREAVPTGAWLHMAGGVGVSARATVFLVDDCASADVFDFAIDAIRGLIAKHDVEFDTPIDPAQEHRRRSGASTQENVDTAKLIATLPTADAPGIVATGEGRLLRVTTHTTPPLSPRAAARAAGVSTVSALFRTASGELAMSTPAILEADPTRAAHIARAAWECHAFDVEWLRSVASTL